MLNECNYQILMENKESYPTIKDFVIQEAHEKAFQKMVMGLKEYEKEKARMVLDRKDVLHEEFDRKHKDSAAQRRIAKSSKINESRMRKMNIRHENLQDLLHSAEHKLVQDICTDDDRYKALLKELILEGLIRMLEPVVFIRCLQKDKRLISQLIPDCKRTFKEIVQKEGIDQTIGEVDLLLDDRYSLSEKKAKSGERVKKSEESNVCFGGVVMTNADGLIVCKNTLDARLELAYQHLLPSIRRRLYDQ